MTLMGSGRRGLVVGLGLSLRLAWGVYLPVMCNMGIY